MTAAARSAEWREACGRIHARAKHLGLDEEARRDLQRRVTGKASCREMNAAELRRVLAAMNGRGGRSGGRAPGDRLPDGDLKGKLRALWISGWHLGVVRDRTDAALMSFVKGATGLDAARFAHDPRDASKAVEGIKAWLKREAGVDWRPYVAIGRHGEPREIDNPRARVLEAQWRILHRLGVVQIADSAALSAYACRHAGIGREDAHTALDRNQADALIRYFGDRIRQASVDADRP